MSLRRRCRQPSESASTGDPTPHTISTVWLNDKFEFGEARWDGETEYQIQNQEYLRSRFLMTGRNSIRITNPGIPEAPYRYYPVELAANRLLAKF